MGTLGEAGGHIDARGPGAYQIIEAGFAGGVSWASIGFSLRQHVSCVELQPVSSQELWAASASQDLLRPLPCLQHQALYSVDCFRSEFSRRAV